MSEGIELQGEGGEEEEKRKKRKKKVAPPPIKAEPVICQ